MIMKLLPFYCLARAFPTQVTIKLDAGMKRLGYLLAVVFRSKWYHLWWDRALNYHCNDQLQYLTQLQGLSMWLVWLGLQLPSIQVHLNLLKDNNKYSPKSLLWYTSTYFSQRRLTPWVDFPICTPLHSFWVELECTTHPNPTTVVVVGTECAYSAAD